MDLLVAELKTTYPQFSFCAGKSFSWSPASQEIRFKSDAQDAAGCWALLHELSHGLLNHQTYRTDLDLLLMEVAAWEQATEIAPLHHQTIDADHVQDCLDTYRDWLNQRSTCPTCGTNGLQQNSRQYQCINCTSTWEVSPSRFCRPYRQLNRGQNKPSPEAMPQATFQ